MLWRKEAFNPRRHASRGSHKEAPVKTTEPMINNNARARALGDVDVHLDGVTGAEVGNVGAERCRIDGVEDLHDLFSLRPPQVDRGK